MPGAQSVTLIGRQNELARFEGVCRRLRQGGTDYLWLTGSSGVGKSYFLQACADQARREGWEVLAGRCDEETRTDPYGPFLDMLGLCFDRGGRLINDRSVYSIIDQLSLEDVFDAVDDIPGMAMVAFGVKVGKSIFESRQHPKSKDDLLNQNFEFILQVLQRIGDRRKKPLMLVVDDLHLASETTYTLLDYLLTRIQDTRMLVVASLQALTAAEGIASIRAMARRLAQSDHVLHLEPFTSAQIRRLLNVLRTRSIADSLVHLLIELSQGIPGILAESVRLIELEDEPFLQGADSLESASSVIRSLLSRQVAHLSDPQRALLECASRIGREVPLYVLAAPSLCAYLGMSERALLSSVVELGERGALLTWDGQDTVRFTSAFVHRYLREQANPFVARRDHLRIAQAWGTMDGAARPALLAEHYLAAGDLAQAISFARQSAQELYLSAAYPEAVESYRVALEALTRSPDREDRLDERFDILRAMSLAAEQAGDWDESLARLQDALDLSEGDPARQAEIHASLGWLRLQRGEVQTALAHLNRSADLYERLEDVRGRAQVEYYLGVLYSAQKDLQRAIECFERYLNTSQEVGFSEGRALALTELGNLYRLRRDWAQAESFLQQGIELAQDQEDYVVLAQGYHYLGSCYSFQGKPEAVDMLQRALHIVGDRTKQPAQEARIQNTLAETLVRAGRWAEAESAFRASIEIKTRLGDKAGLAMSYGGLGRMYSRQWRFDQAAVYLQKDIDLLAQEFEANVAWIQQLTNLLGQVHLLQGQLDLAEQCLTKALSLAERIPDAGVQKTSAGYTHMLLARVAMDRGEMASAGEACALAQDLLSGTWAVGEVQRTVARYARLCGEMERAGTYLNQALRSSARGEDIEQALAHLEAAHFYRDIEDGVQMREHAGQVARLARRLQNVELERQANQLLRRE